MRATVLFSLAVAGVVSAQDSAPTLASTAVAPAATQVETPPEASVELFTDETLQVTDDVIANLKNNENVGELADLFAFGDSEVISERKRRMRRTLKCKTTPDDLLWPSSFTWGVFDLLLGGALEKVVPIASVCYPKSEFNNYDAAKCADVTNNWAVEETQYVHILTPCICVENADLKQLQVRFVSNVARVCRQPVQARHGSLCTGNLHAGWILVVLGSCQERGPGPAGCQLCPIPEPPFGG